MPAPGRVDLAAGHVLLLRLDADALRLLHRRDSHRRAGVPSLTYVSVPYEVSDEIVSRLTYSLIKRDVQIYAYVKAVRSVIPFEMDDHLACLPYCNRETALCAKIRIRLIY